MKFSVINKTIRARGFMLLLCMLPSFHAYAANVGTGMLRIKSVVNWGSGGSEQLFVQLEQTAPTNPAGCAITDKYDLENGSSSISRSMVLSAAMAGKPLNLVIGGSGCADSGRPKVVAVEVN